MIYGQSDQSGRFDMTVTSPQPGVGRLELVRYDMHPSEIHCLHADPVVEIWAPLMINLRLPNNPWGSVLEPIVPGSIVRFTLTNGTWVYVLDDYIPSRDTWIAHWPD